MKGYHQLTDDERYRIVAMRSIKMSLRGITLELGRNVSTISREIRRNAYATDGRYGALHASQKARGRRRMAREGTRFSMSDWQTVRELIRKKFSPMQVSGVLKRYRELSISHETIYQHVWEIVAAEGIFMRTFARRGRSAASATAVTTVGGGWLVSALSTIARSER